MIESLQSVAMIFLMVFAVIYGLVFLGMAGVGVYTFWEMCKDEREAAKKDRKNRI